MTPVIINELLSSGTTSYDLSESTMVDYFTIKSTAFCGGVTFSLYKDDLGSIASAWTSADVQLDGNLLKISSTQAVNSKVYLKATTKGLVSTIKPIFVSNCAKTTAITLKDSLSEKSFNFTSNSSSSSSD